MFYLDENFLMRLGLGELSTEDKEGFLEVVHQELELRVGHELSKELSDEQLDALEELIAMGMNERAARWLQEHCPNYRQVVAAEIDALVIEIAGRKDDFLSVVLPA